jgi:hypothetical protein
MQQVQWQEPLEAVTTILLKQPDLLFEMARPASLRVRLTTGTDYTDQTSTLLKFRRPNPTPFGLPYPKNAWAEPRHADGVC